MTSFALDVMTLYYVRADKKRLRPDFLSYLVSRFSSDYDQLKKPITSDSYKTFLRACVDGLMAFTEKIHPICLETDPTTSLFHTVHKAKDFIGKSDPDNKDPKERFVFGPSQYEAYSALAAPFKNLSHLFNADCVMRPLYFCPVSDPGNCPFNYSIADKSDQRAWDRKVHEWQKADSKASDEAYAELSTMQVLMLGTLACTRFG